MNIIDVHLYDLFRTELETESMLLEHELVALEQREGCLEHADELMRAVHSIKGAVSVIKLEPLVHLLHAMEDCILAGKTRIEGIQTPLLFQALDLIKSLQDVPLETLFEWMKKNDSFIQQLVIHLKNGVPLQGSKIPLSPYITKSQSVEEGKTVRISSTRLHYLMGLAGESVMETLWLEPITNSLLKLKQHAAALLIQAEQFQEAIRDLSLSQHAEELIYSFHEGLVENRLLLDQQIADLELFVHHHSGLLERLYNEMIDMRMRPFTEGVQGFFHLVKDLGEELKKHVRLEISGENTTIDREILEKLEVPLTHLIRNAIDHGIEPSEERVLRGKPPEGVVRIEASRQKEKLMVIFSDDGRGVDVSQLREKIVQEQVASKEKIDQMSDQEVCEFLFLPGFSTAPSITEMSGRGIGLNVVKAVTDEMGGVVQIHNIKGSSLTFILELPLSFSGEGVPKKNQRVLVVEDSMTVRAVERSLLQEKGYDVHCVADGKEGWKALSEGHYDLVITDVDMPRMNGIELIKAIKKDPLLQKIPVIVVSYKERPEDRKAALKAGAEEYLIKSSFHDETLLQAIERVLKS